MKKLQVLIGLPCSGKSTYAMDFLKKEENWFRISRDDIRMTMFGTEHNPLIEGLVTKLQTTLMLKALKADMNVIVDNCNIRASYRQDLFNIASLVGDVLYEEKIFDTSLQECIKRNKERARKVPEDVIVKFAKEGREILWGKYKPRKEFIAKPESSNLIQDPSLPKAVICDNDGTLSLLNGRNPYDASTCDKDLPHEHVIEMIKLYHSAGYQIIFLSGREDKYREPTIKFYETYLPDITDYILYMRKTGDQRKDVIIKEEIYTQQIDGKYFISAWVDDRLQVCRWVHDKGLPLFRVNDPESDF